MGRPTLIIISGPSGAGKTTLAHELAAAIPCIAICRDEIKEGMVHTVGDFEAGPGDDLTRRTFPLFFEVIERLLQGGVTVVAEAAFQDKLWRTKLGPLLEIAELRVVQCHSPDAPARAGGRSRKAHADFIVTPEFYAGFERLTMQPSMDVDTTEGYVPSMDEIVAFVNRR